jgi:hypothetical protein
MDCDGLCGKVRHVMDCVALWLPETCRKPCSAVRVRQREDDSGASLVPARGCPAPQVGWSGSNADPLDDELLAIASEVSWLLKQLSRWVQARPASVGSKLFCVARTGLVQAFSNSTGQSLPTGDASAEAQARGAPAAGTPWDPAKLETGVRRGPALPDKRRFLLPGGSVARVLCGKLTAAVRPLLQVWQGLLRLPGGAAGSGTAQPLYLTPAAAAAAALVAGVQAPAPDRRQRLEQLLSEWLRPRPITASPCVVLVRSAPQTRPEIPVHANESQSPEFTIIAPTRSRTSLTSLSLSRQLAPEHRPPAPAAEGGSRFAYQPSGPPLERLSLKLYNTRPEDLAPDAAAQLRSLLALGDATLLQVRPVWDERPERAVTHEPPGPSEPKRRAAAEHRRGGLLTLALPGRPMAATPRASGASM